MLLSTETVDQTRTRLMAMLGSDEQTELAKRVAAAGVDGAACRELVSRVTEQPETVAPLRSLRDRLSAHGGLAPGALERFLLATTALGALDRLERLPLAPTSKLLAGEMFTQWTRPSTTLHLEENHFTGYAKLASLRRFPAGLFDYEPSGLPRSWIPRIRPFPQLARALWITGARWKSFGPVFYAHLTVCRPIRAMLERDALKSYYLIARSIALQPQVRGMITSAWLFSPDTYAVSPHLAWMDTVFLENGGLVATMGLDSPDSGVLHRSPERQRAYENGTFRPTLGLIIWPREEMIAWANAHSELDW